MSELYILFGEYLILTMFLKFWPIPDLTRAGVTGSGLLKCFSFFPKICDGIKVKAL